MGDTRDLYLGAFDSIFGEIESRRLDRLLSFGESFLHDLLEPVILKTLQITVAEIHA